MRREKLELNEEQEKQLSELEEEIIKKEILPALSDDIAPRLEPIKRDLVLVVEYHPGEPISVALSRKAKISEIVGTKLMQPDPPAEHKEGGEHKKPEEKKVKKAPTPAEPDDRIKDGEGIIPQGTTEIDSYMFSRRSDLKSVVIPNTARVMHERAFYRNEGLTSVKILGPIKTIQRETFFRCTALTDVELPEAVTSIGFRAFLGCRSLKSIKLPSGLRIISNGAFAACNSLTKIEIPKSINSIGDVAFAQCNSLKEVVIPRKFGFRLDKIFGDTRNMTIRYI